MERKKIKIERRELVSIVIKNDVMGVRGLYTFCKKYGKIVTHEQLCRMTPPQKIGIDISHYVFKWQGNTRKLVEYLQSFQKASHKPLCVFDGKHEQAKLPEAERRNNRRAWEIQEAERLETLLEKNREDLSQEQIDTFTRMIQSHRRHGWQLTQEVRHNIKRALYAEYIPLVKSEREADTLLASLAHYEKFDWIISGDLDLLALGVTNLLVPLQEEDSTDYLHIHYPTILQSLQMSEYQFKQMCAISCTDSVTHSIPPNISQVYPQMRKYRDMNTLRRNYYTLAEEWPTQKHIYFESIPKPEMCIFEPDYINYIAYTKDTPMPYLSPENAPYDPVLEKHL
jgi:hypothetical protein